MLKESIYFIDLKDNNTFLLTPDNQIQTDFKTKPKKAITATRLSYDDIIIHSFKLDKKYTQDELAFQVELKMYEDLNLDLQKVYHISYIQKPTQIEDTYLIEAFAYDIDAIKQKYEKNLKSFKHIDFIAAPSLIYQTLYENKYLQKNSNDVFIYIDKSEAFVSFYKDGAYITSKKIKSLDIMANELNNKNINYTSQELKEILQTKGIDKNQYDLSEYSLYEYLHEVFENIFSTVKNIALHSRSIYQFENVDKVYIYANNQLLTSLKPLVQNYLQEATIHPLFGNFDQTKSNLLDLLSAYYIQNKIAKNDLQENLTFYKKKTPFYKREVGKFTLIATAALVLIAIYPSYKQYQIYTQTQENQTLQEKYDHLVQTTKKLETKDKKIKKEIKSYSKKEKEIDQKFAKLQKVTQKLLALKTKDNSYTTIFLTVNQLLQKYHLSLSQVKQTGERSLDLEIYSKQSKRDTIALFMQELLAKGYKNVSSNEITLNDDTYKSIINIQR